MYPARLHVGLDCHGIGHPLGPIDLAIASLANLLHIRNLIFGYEEVHTDMVILQILIELPHLHGPAILPRLLPLLLNFLFRCTAIGAGRRFAVIILLLTILYLVVIGLFVGFLGGFDLFAFGLLFTGYEDWHVGVLLLVFFLYSSALLFF
jgi:hypothetical protein